MGWVTGSCISVMLRVMLQTDFHVDTQNIYKIVQKIQLNKTGQLWQLTAHSLISKLAFKSATNAIEQESYGICAEEMVPGCRFF